MGNAKFLDIRTKVQILLMYSHNCHLYIVCSYVLLFFCLKNDIREYSVYFVCFVVKVSVYHLV